MIILYNNNDLTNIKLLWSGDVKDINETIVLSDSRNNYSFLLFKTTTKIHSTNVGALDKCTIIPSNRAINELNQICDIGYLNNTSARIDYYAAIIYFKFTSNTEILITDAFRIYNNLEKQDYHQLHISEIYGVKSN